MILREKNHSLHCQLLRKKKALNAVHEECKRLKQKCAELEQSSLALPNGSFSLNTKNFLLSQNKANNVSAKGMRWTLKDKQQALNLYYISPAAYRMQSKLFHLPHKDTLLSPAKYVFQKVIIVCILKPNNICYFYNVMC